MNKRLCLSIHILFFYLLTQPMGTAQSMEDYGDYDVIMIPVGRALSPQDGNFAASTLQEMGMSLLSVTDASGREMPLGEVQTATDEIQITLKPDQAVRLWSDPIHLSSQTTHFSADVSLQGERPLQAAAAFVDILAPQHLGVSLSMAQDLPIEDRSPLTFDFDRQVRSAILLIQFLGPAEGTSTITLQKMRVLAGYRQIDFALGCTNLSRIYTFDVSDDENDPAVLTMIPPTTPGTELRLLDHVNHSSSFGVMQRSLSLSAESAQDVIQVAIPLQPQNVTRNPSAMLKVYAQAYVKRIGGDEGIFSLALFNGVTASGGYRDYPISEIPQEDWLKIETPVSVVPDDLQNLVLILQIREGQAEIAIDDVSLQADIATTHFWQYDR